ncbi:hypothetical protein ACFLUG_01840 [Chloroflexota bacterium]
MMRAVIKLKNNIGYLMPSLSKEVEKCAYDPEDQILSIRYQEMGISIRPRKIVIYNASDQATAQSVLDWLKTIIKFTSENIANSAVQ